MKVTHSTSIAHQYAKPFQRTDRSRKIETLASRIEEIQKKKGHLISSNKQVSEIFALVKKKLGDLQQEPSLSQKDKQEFIENIVRGVQKREGRASALRSALSQLKKDIENLDDEGSAVLDSVREIDDADSLGKELVKLGSILDRISEAKIGERIISDKIGQASGNIRKGKGAFSMQSSSREQRANIHGISSIKEKRLGSDGDKQFKGVEKPSKMQRTFGQSVRQYGLRALKYGASVPALGGIVNSFGALGGGEYMRLAQFAFVAGTMGALYFWADHKLQQQEPDQAGQGQHGGNT